MSRLEEIKNKYVNCPILEHLEGIDIIGMDSKDKNYLIQQAERVRELEDVIHKDERQAVLEGLYEQNQRYKQALEQVREMTKESIMDGRIYIVVDKALKGESE